MSKMVEIAIWDDQGEKVASMLVNEGDLVVNPIFVPFKVEPGQTYYVGAVIRDVPTPTSISAMMEKRD